jgi:hypothetical protein
MENQKLEGLELAIDVWKKNNISSARFNFSCGGDSMGDTQLEYFVKNESSLFTEGELPDLDNYFNDVIYREVDFYENSDGHYMGESGYVEITFDDDEKEFSYYKDAYEEWSEEISNDFKVELTKEQADFLREYVSSIEIDNYNGNSFSYKKDLIFDDEKRNLVDEIDEYLLGLLEDEDGFEYPDDFEENHDERRCEIYLESIEGIEEVDGKYFLTATFYVRGTVTRFGEY